MGLSAPDCVLPLDICTESPSGSPRNTVAHLPPSLIPFRARSIALDRSQLSLQLPGLQDPSWGTHKGPGNGLLKAESFPGFQKDAWHWAVTVPAPMCAAHGSVVKTQSLEPETTSNSGLGLWGDREERAPSFKKPPKGRESVTDPHKGRDGMCKGPGVQGSHQSYGSLRVPLCWERDLNCFWSSNSLWPGPGRSYLCWPAFSQCPGLMAALQSLVKMYRCWPPMLMAQASRTFSTLPELCSHRLSCELPASGEFVPKKVWPTCKYLLL